MTETPENLMLVFLRRLDEKSDNLSRDMREVKNRLGIIESHLGVIESQYASLSSRQDRLDERIERIERRLNITDA